jgi:hypothetical protein
MFVLIAAPAVSLLTMALWNNLMPSIFGLPHISAWQALGLLVLGRLLFGGFRGPHGRWNRRARLIKGWESLTPEERERFRAGMRGRCGRDVPDSEPQPQA